MNEAHKKTVQQVFDKVFGKVVINAELENWDGNEPRLVFWPFTIFNEEVEVKSIGGPRKVPGFVLDITTHVSYPQEPDMENIDELLRSRNFGDVVMEAVGHWAKNEASIILEMGYIEQQIEDDKVIEKMLEKDNIWRDSSEGACS